MACTGRTAETTSVSETQNYKFIQHVSSPARSFLLNATAGHAYRNNYLGTESEDMRRHRVGSCAHQKSLTFDGHFVQHVTHTHRQGYSVGISHCLHSAEHVDCKAIHGVNPANGGRCYTGTSLLRAAKPAIGATSGEHHMNTD